MFSPRTPFQRLIARLLAATLLVVGLLDPSAMLADTLQDHAPEKCATLTLDRSAAPQLALTDTDIGDETADLEQLLRPRALAIRKNTPSDADFPPLAAGQLLATAPPLLRPPILRR